MLNTIQKVIQMKKQNTIQTTYDACAIIEGFHGGEPPTLTDTLNAWAYLIKTGQCWTLQGWYGRNAENLIDNGIIDSDGEILMDESEIEEMF